MNDLVFWVQVDRGLKGRILDWIQAASGAMRPGDRMVIVIATHGTPKSGSIYLQTAHDKELLLIDELYIALKQLPEHVRILFVNLACFSRGKAS